METLKEVMTDALILIAAWFLMTASNISAQARGLTCGKAETAISATADANQEAP